MVGDVVDQTPFYPELADEAIQDNAHAAIQSAPRVLTSSVMCGKDWQQSNKIFASEDFLRVGETISSIGWKHPNTLETCLIDTTLVTFVFSFSSPSNTSMLSLPVPRGMKKLGLPSKMTQNCCGKRQKSAFRGPNRAEAFERRAPV